ncbi:MAG: asparagine synthase-related protein, partial [Candidatus Binatia bacterium]
VHELREAYLVQRALGPELPEHGGLSVPVWNALAPPPALSGFRLVSYLELVFYLRSQLLRDADIFSSANSVELRVPFLDLDVLRTAWTLPGSWHLGRFGGRKRVLKALLRRLEPAHPVHRAKMGFVFPWAEWLRGALGAHVATTLDDRDAHAALGLDAAASARVLAAFRRRDPRVGWAQVWSRFVLLEWYRQVGLGVPSQASAAPTRVAG